MLVLPPNVLLQVKYIGKVLQIDKPPIHNLHKKLLPAKHCEEVKKEKDKHELEGNFTHRHTEHFLKNYSGLLLFVFAQLCRKKVSTLHSA